MAGQLWGTDSVGGYLYSDELSKTLRESLRPTTKFRQFADARDFSDKGLNKGDAANFNTVSEVATGGTVLSEGTSMPETNITITRAQITVDEYGNSVPFTSKVTDMAKQDVVPVIKGALSKDASRTLDSEAHAAFDDTPLRYVGTATDGGVLTTNGTATATNASNLLKVHVRTIVDTMKERNIPAWQGDDYVAIANPTTLRPLRNELESVHQYVTEGYQKITAGEIGRFEGVRFVEQTNIQKGVGTNGTAWSSAKSDWCYFFGADTVGEVIVLPPEIRAKIPSDYGRSHGIAWYAIEGFGIIHSDELNARIIKWDSAA